MKNRLLNVLLYLREPRLRSISFQIFLLGTLIVFIWAAADNAVLQLTKQNIVTGFGFLNENAGFGVSQSLIEYNQDSTYGRALLVGLLNTLLVAILGIVLATIIGFSIGIARLSANKLISTIATFYVEIIRNIPLLLQIFFWYFAVFGNLPSPRQGIELGAGFFINRRGFYIPKLDFDPAMIWVVLIFVLSIIAVFILSHMAARHRQATGESWPILRWSFMVLFFPALFVYFITNQPASLDFAHLQGFNFQGGLQINPEFSALLLALSIYTAAFIAEIVRSGIESVKRGQVEAGLSLGLSRWLVLRKITIPQAMRVIIPPLTSQYLNLTKNSSLAVAIAYPDLVSVFAGTVLNQTGQALEIIFITMLVYLIISTSTAAAMNIYNRHLLKYEAA